LAVRAVLAPSGAGFSTVSLVAHGRPTLGRRALARRGIAVQWMGAPSGEPVDPSTSTMASSSFSRETLLTQRLAPALRKASAGPVRKREGRLVGVVCRPSDVPQYLERPHLWRARRAPERSS
jgi:hypothetical protein